MCVSIYTHTEKERENIHCFTDFMDQEDIHTPKMNIH